MIVSTEFESCSLDGSRKVVGQKLILSPFFEKQDTESCRNTLVGVVLEVCGAILAECGVCVAEA